MGVFLVSGLVVGVSTAGAQSEDAGVAVDPEADARARYDSGAEHYRSGRFAEAAAAFAQAYELSPRPALLQNLYLARRDAGDLAGAADALRRFLLEATELPAEERQMLNHRLRALERQLAAPTSGADAPAEDPPPNGAASPPVGATGSPGGVTIGGWSLVGGAGALGIAAAIGGGLMLAERDGLYSLCNAGPAANECPPSADVEGHVARFETARAVMWGGVALGAAALTAGVILLVVGDPPPESPTVTAACDPGGCTVELRGGF